MITIQLKAAITLVTLFLVISIAAKAIGSLQPINNPLLSGFTEGCKGKPQSCWYGIVIGVTTVEDAQITIESLGYSVVFSIENQIFFQNEDDELPCVNISLQIGRQGELELLTFSQCRNLKVGDFTVLGLPKRIHRGYGGQLLILLNEFFILSGDLCTEDRYNATRCLNELTQNTNLEGLLVGSKNSIDPYGSIVGQWHGFVPLWRYCQLAPQSIRCE